MNKHRMKKFSTRLQKISQLTLSDESKRQQLVESVLSGNTGTYIKHPDTGELVAVSPELFKKIFDGEVVYIEDILKAAGENVEI